ncbi:MAG: drug/metabolite exporter YedA [Candidatus Margulisbacteria bacterium]|nr:drug/metabolite exporter YedA [Candidatus Margulisiibacteriota bacterium]
MKKNTAMIIICLLAVYIIWGSTYLAIRLSVATIPPLLMCGIRFLLAGGILYAFLRLKRISQPSRQHWQSALAVGTLMMAGGTGFVALAEQYVSSGLAAIAITMTPVWACVISGLIHKKWPNRLEWLGLIIGFCGIVVLNLEHELRLNLWGAFFLLLAPICWAAGSVLSTILPKPQSGLMASALQMLTGGVVCVLIGVVLGERISALPSMISALALIYLILAGSLLGFTAYMYLFRHTRPALATSYSYINPVIAVMLGVWLAGEKIGHFAFLGLTIAILGVLFVMLGHGE